MLFIVRDPRDLVISWVDRAGPANLHRAISGVSA
jgi:hypothetical protein